MTLQILPKEARSADNSLYNNDLSGDRIVYFASKKTYFACKKTGFPAALCWYIKKLSALSRLF
ncbi:MAG: hypothetical protein LBD13_04880 [Spirochaetaceae bacterium]|jgi:hypothetical protein|nr:hypothetical protein [Spirochaetaceae bacterium]